MILKQKGNMKTGLAIIIGLIIVALLIWYPTNTQDNLNTIEQELEETQTNLEGKIEEAETNLEYLALKTELETRLLAIKADIAADNITQDTEDKLQEIQSDLALAYESAEDISKQEIKQIELELMVVEDNLREDTATALNALDSVIDQVRQDIITEENGQ